MKIGYARVSTLDQKLDAQIDVLHEQGCAQIYQEHRSGKDRERPELENCLKALREGDMLVVVSLDRLGRNLRDLITIVNELEQRGIGFQSVRESFNTGGAFGKMLFQFFGAIAEFERNRIRERTLEGLKAARARGKKGGRPVALTEKQIASLKAQYKDRNISIETLMKTYNISRTTVYRYVKSR